jgi:hypothetical protein
MEEFIGWLIGQRTTVMLREVDGTWCLSMRWRPHWFAVTHKFTSRYATKEMALWEASQVAAYWVKSA